MHNSGLPRSSYFASDEFHGEYQNVSSSGSVSTGGTQTAGSGVTLLLVVGVILVIGWLL